MDEAIALDALAALAQPTRLAVFRLLVRTRPTGLYAGEIADRLGVVQNTLSTHLAVLARAGLVEAHREGRAIRYVADADRMRDLIAYLLEDCCGGRPEICGPLAGVLAASAGSSDDSCCAGPDHEDNTDTVRSDR
ncbi:MAG TPA: metalloregulator ArsR/SmtB family transcription factor [Kaistiaceae bacterium]|nr:metalloregulator ArsR/SmtB family transcription factor [Kaistiaceae bacterium]